MPTKAQYGDFTGFINQAVTLMNLVTQAGIAIAPSAVSTITRTVTRENNGAPVTVQDHVGLTVGSALSASIQGANSSDPQWKRDNIGYNFIDKVPAIAFPMRDRYTVSYAFTPAVGTPFAVVWRGTILSNAGAI